MSSDKKQAMIERVASKYLQKVSTRLESHADFVRAINTAFMDKEDQSLLSSIQSKARSLEDKEFGKAISDLCGELISRLDYMEELRDEGSQYTW